MPFINESGDVHKECIRLWELFKKGILTEEQLQLEINKLMDVPNGAEPLADLFEGEIIEE